MDNSPQNVTFASNGATTHDADEAGKLMQELPVDRAARDLGGAVDYLLVLAALPEL